MNNSIKYSLIALALLTTSVRSTAAQTDSQKFTVTVPSNISIVAPDDVAITHDESEDDQDFPAQAWVVKGNTLAGVSVSFSTGTAFVHTSNPTSKRDATLGLAFSSKQGPATWTVTTATDATDYANSNEVATVSASSNGVGVGTFNLAVSFVTDGFGSFAAGNYETTVTGTVTAN